MKNYLNDTKSLCITLILILFLAFFCIPILTDGMFFDGIVYASVAKNYANGLGEFWKMEYTKTIMTPFNAHPPFVFFLQSLFFSILGDSIYTERIYCIVFALLTIFIMLKVWKMITGNMKYVWLPVIIWFVIPVNNRSYQNNLIEVTMSFFDLAAIYFLLAGYKEHSNKKIIIAGMFVFLASFCKGFQGLFPLAFPALYAISFKDYSYTKIVLKTSLLLSAPLSIYTALFFCTAARENYIAYFNQRLVNTFLDGNGTTVSHFYLLLRLIFEMSFPAIPLILVYLLKRKKVVSEKTNDSNTRLFFLIGLSASLPLMITLEQRGFYLVTSFPYYSIALALLFIPVLKTIDDSYIINYKRQANRVLLSIFCILLLASFYIIPHPKSDEILLKDISVIQKLIPENSIVGVSEKVFSEWQIHAYFMRLADISLDNHLSHEYIIERKDEHISTEEYEKCNIPVQLFNIYKRKK